MSRQMDHKKSQRRRWLDINDIFASNYFLSGAGIIPELSGCCMHFSAQASLQTREIASRFFKIIPEFVSEKAQQALKDECARGLRKSTWLRDHFDSVITNYRERVVSTLSDFPAISELFERAIRPAFFSGSTCLPPHIVEISADGFIRPHVDKYCGPTIVGLSLGAARIMRLRKLGSPEDYFEVELPPGSLYWQSGTTRYSYEHEILKSKLSASGNRISIVFRETEVLS